MASNSGGGLLARLFPPKEPPKPAMDEIPPGAPIYGAGPNFVNDSRKAPYTITGDPWAPIEGDPEHGQPTHAQVIREMSYGDPRPNPKEPTAYWAKRDQDDASRHGVQVVDGNGWQTPVDYNVIPVYSRGVRPPSDRPMTSAAHPELDSMIVTDYVNEGAQRLTGQHFSMADHRRDFRVYEQTPVRGQRNTWRLEPTAWDLDLVDVPEQTGVGMADGPAGYEAVASFVGKMNSYRLGG